jgi:hypothetical protein
MPEEVPFWFDPPVTTSSVLSGNFTFVSPTAYIAHHPIKGVSRVRVGGNPPTHSYSDTLTISAGVFPIEYTDIYTKYYPISDARGWVKAIAEGKQPILWDPPLPVFRVLD